MKRSTLRTMRKPRPFPGGLKAKLAELSPEQFNAFHALLKEDITYAQMRERVKEEFGITTSETAIGEYYKSGDRESWMAHAGEQTTVVLSRFELLISCPRPGVVSIVAKELPAETVNSPKTEQPPAHEDGQQPSNG